MLEAVGDRPVGLIPGVGPKTARAAGGGGDRESRELANAEPARWSGLFGPRLGALPPLAGKRHRRPSVVDRAGAEVREP